MSHISYVEINQQQAKVIETLRAENEALKQQVEREQYETQRAYMQSETHKAEMYRLFAQVEQGKRDAVPEELRSLINKAQSHMMRTREADQVSVALTQYLIAAAPKQDSAAF